jgi:hypothetical protein
MKRFSVICADRAGCEWTEFESDNGIEALDKADRIRQIKHPDWFVGVWDDDRERAIWEPDDLED